VRKNRFRFFLTTAAINDKRIYRFSMVNDHLSFGGGKLLACAVLIEALRMRASSQSAGQRRRTAKAPARKSELNPMRSSF
jgi:hypothetical protein